MTSGPVGTHRPWGWFIAWWLAGGLWSLALLAIATVGLFVLPLAVAATAFLAWRSQGSGVMGLLSGLGVPAFYVAYLNRGGPGNVCTAIASGGESCTQEWSPWPWLAAALVLTASGLLIFRFRNTGHPDAEHPPRHEGFRS